MNRLFLSDFRETWIFWAYFLKILIYQISWKSVHWEPSCSIGTDRLTDMTKLIVASLNFANAPKMTQQKYTFSSYIFTFIAHTHTPTHTHTHHTHTKTHQHTHTPHTPHTHTHTQTHTHHTHTHKHTHTHHTHTNTNTHTHTQTHMISIFLFTVMVPKLRFLCINTIYNSLSF